MRFNVISGWILVSVEPTDMKVYVLVGLVGRKD